MADDLVRIVDRIVTSHWAEYSCQHLHGTKYLLRVNWNGRYHFQAEIDFRTMHASITDASERDLGILSRILWVLKQWGYTYDDRC